MADYPALPLWTDAYLADTRHLTCVQHGAYLLLLMEAWRRPHKSLPDDDALLAKLACLSEAEWAAVKPVVMAFWKLDKRTKEFVQKRLSAEAKFVGRKRRLQRDRAAKRWNKKKNDDAVAMPDGCRIDAPTPTPTPTIEEERTVAKATDQLALVDQDPPVIKDAVWQAGLAYLGSVVRKPEPQLRRLLGRWCGEFGEVLVWQALAQSQQHKPVEAVSWIEGWLLRRRPRDGPEAEHPNNQMMRELGLGPENRDDQADGDRADVVQLRAAPGLPGR